MTNTHVVIYIAANAEQAHMLKNALDEAGIFAYVSNESLQIACGDLPMGLPTAPRVIVDEHDAEEAREIALEFDRAGQTYLSKRSRQHSHLGEPSNEDEDEYDLEDDVEEKAIDWPTCPHCRRPRQTSCPVCETAGTDFPPAFLPDEDTDDEKPTEGALARLLVLCPTCDEPFAPEFLARCEWCGHHFRDGRGESLPANVTSPFEDVNSRVWIVIGGLVLLFLGTLAMLAHIMPEP